ncbi:MAG: excinuclease ABC subunit UvrA [Bacteroidia bacterium]|nr:excinuclease ABC subunit UvrA [Bacteroidia bacterium]
MSTLEKKIRIVNAQQHNLKNINVEIDHGSFTVVTGVSGSGKSSLVFETLFAEGQRRYVESLSSYARQFLGRMKKPLVDDIQGLCPAVAIEQKVNTRNPRSTVATSTEIYDYIKLLFSRAGHTISPISGREVKRETSEDVLQYCQTHKVGERALIMAIQPEKTRSTADWDLLIQKGFSRIWCENQLFSVQTLLDEQVSLDQAVYLVVDRLLIQPEDEEFQSRLFDACETAFWEGDGNCTVYFMESQVAVDFNNRFELDGVKFEIPTKDFLSFNNPHGACRTCEGFGSVLGLDRDLVIPDTALSVFEGAVAPWKGETMGEWRNDFIRLANKVDFPIHRAIRDLDESQLKLLWEGSKALPGILDFFKYIEDKSYKIQYRVLAARYRGKTTCPDCLGTRLRKEAAYVKVLSTSAPEQLSIQELLLMEVDTALSYFKQLAMNETDTAIAERIIEEIKGRLQFLSDVGLGYLSLNRLSNTLSGGESQRINLATSLGSNLTGSMYILDEPSIGLHSRDTERLITVLKALQKEGNTVIVVEHDEDIMRNAENVIDIGPFAGTLGGQLLYQGPFEGISHCSDSLTGKYLLGSEQIEVPSNRRKSPHYIELEDVTANNLKNVTCKFRLESFTVVTGVSGSGKTTLIKQVLFPALSRELGLFTTTKPGKFKKLSGAVSLVKAVEMVDQNPIGKSSRSNPVTYVKAFDEIRDLFANTPTSKFNGFKPSHFSFNVDGGRCDVCQGEGETVIEMQFMADIKLECEACGGHRYKKEVLEVEYNGKNIFEVLDLTVDEAMDFFADVKSVRERIKPLQDVGLGYVKLGQGSNTLSGGEAQRVKLAFFLSKASPNKEGGTLFIFDEPTTGLHFHDIKKLMKSFDALIAQGNTVLCIEHNLDVVKCADWIIDLGPEAGSAGGEMVFQGVPEDMVAVTKSVTAPYLAEKLR